MKISIKSLVIYLSLSIILNSCSVYFKKEVSFNEAYISKKSVRLITNENKKVFIKKIILKDSAYYGISHYKGEKIEIPLSNETRKSLRIKNRTASTIINVTGITLSLGIVALVFVADSYNSWGNFNSDGNGTQFKN